MHWNCCHDNIDVYVDAVFTSHVGIVFDNHVDIMIYMLCICDVIMYVYLLYHVILF